MIFTIRNSSCGKVVFLHLSVILLTGPLSGGRPPPGRPEADGTHPTGMHSCSIYDKFSKTL